MGFEIWPWILIISNTESLSADQAVALRGCLNERESDAQDSSHSKSKSLYDDRRDWPRSIIFVLKQGEFLPAHLRKFVRKVLKP
jgi:hypothetical protein